ncbi:hypothetical protein Q8G38_15510, partial [Halomonas venusta]|uniref:hypothetical protein n=1 Tax=Vreelandella venusta TaxID=44935 RepID=UPI00295EC50A
MLNWGFGLLQDKDKDKDKVDSRSPHSGMTVWWLGDDVRCGRFVTGARECFFLPRKQKTQP